MAHGKAGESAAVTLRKEGPAVVLRFDGFTPHRCSRLNCECTFSVDERFFPLFRSNPGVRAHHAENPRQRRRTTLAFTFLPRKQVLAPPKSIRELDGRVTPGLPDGRKPNPHAQARREDDDPFIFPLPREGDAAIGKFSGQGEWEIISVLEKSRIIAPERQHPLGQEHFDSAILPLG